MLLVGVACVASSCCSSGCVVFHVSVVLNCGVARYVGGGFFLLFFPLRICVSCGFAVMRAPLSQDFVLIF